MKYIAKIGGVKSKCVRLCSHDKKYMIENMKITKEMYEKIGHMFPKQKNDPKISNLEVLNAALNIIGRTGVNDVH